MRHRNNATQLDELMATRQRIIETVNPSQVLLAAVDQLIRNLNQGQKHETTSPQRREQIQQRALFP